MSKTFRHERFGREYGSGRRGRGRAGTLGGWWTSGRFTKTGTHRCEHRNAKADIRAALDREVRERPSVCVYCDMPREPDKVMCRFCDALAGWADDLLSRMEFHCDIYYASVFDDGNTYILSENDEGL